MRRCRKVGKKKSTNERRKCEREECRKNFICSKKSDRRFCDQLCANRANAAAAARVRSDRARENRSTKLIRRRHETCGRGSTSTFADPHLTYATVATMKKARV